MINQMKKLGGHLVFWSGIVATTVDFEISGTTVLSEGDSGCKVECKGRKGGKISGCILRGG